MSDRERMDQEERLRLYAAEARLCKGKARRPLTREVKRIRHSRRSRRRLRSR